MALNDDDFQYELFNLRHKLSISEAEKARDIKFKHLEFIKKFFPDKVITESDASTISIGFFRDLQVGKIRKFVTITSWVIPGITGALSAAISGGSQNVVFGGALGLAGGPIYQEALKHIIDKLQLEQKKKQQIMLAGRIRDWLEPLLKEDYKNPTS
jgi:hypothetical protein